MTSAEKDLSKHAQIAGTDHRQHRPGQRTGGLARRLDGCVRGQPGRHGQEQDLLAGVAGGRRRLDAAASRHRRRPRQRARRGAPTGDHWRSRRSAVRRRARRTLHVLPVAAPGETRTIATMKDGVGELSWSPDGRWIAFTSRTRDERYDAEDESWQAPRKVERFFSKLDNEGWIFDRPSHVYVVAADGTGAPRNLTPGEFQHDVDRVEARLQRTGAQRAAPRHVGSRLRRAPCTRVPLDGDDRRSRPASTGSVRRSACRRTVRTWRFLGADDSQTYPQNVHVGVVPTGGGEHRWLSRELDRTFETTAGGARAVARRLRPCWPPRRTAARPICTASRSTAAAPKALTSGPIAVNSFDAAGGTIAYAAAAVDAVSDIFVARRRRTAAADLVRRQLSGRRQAQHVGALRRAVHRRQRRDRRLDHAPGRLRRVDDLSGAAQRARWPAHPVRRDVLRRGAGAICRRLRRAHEQPARRLRSRAVVGTVDPRAKAPRVHRAPAGAASTSTTCWPCSTPRSSATRSATPTASACIGGSYGGFMATWLAGLPRRPLQGDLQRARRQQHDHRGVHQRHRHGLPGRDRPRARSTTRRNTSASRRSASCATSTCRC